MFRACLASVFFLFCNACISIEGDPRLLKCAFDDSLDCADKIFDEGFAEPGSVDRAELAERADEITGELDETFAKLSGDHPLVQRLERLRSEFLQAVDSGELESSALRNQASGGMLGFGSKSPPEKYDDLLRTAVTRLAQADLVLLVSDAPAAYVFPNNRIYITTGLVDPDAPYGARDDDALAGVMAHEMFHLLEDHIVEHWRVLDASGVQTAKIALAVATLFGPVRINTVRPAPYAHKFAERIEFLADAGAVRFLEITGRDPGAYIAYLRSLAAGTQTKTRDEAQFLLVLEGRARCAQQCRTPSDAFYHPYKVEEETSSSSTSYRLTLEHREEASRFSPRQQYYLCAKSEMELKSGRDKDVIQGWLQEPGQVPLESLSAELSGQGRDFVSEYIQTLSGKIRVLEIRGEVPPPDNDPFSILREHALLGTSRIFGNITGDRLHIFDGCKS